MEIYPLQDNSIVGVPVSFFDSFSKKSDENPTPGEVRIRVEITETHLKTEYYSVPNGAHLPFKWNNMTPDEKHLWLRNIGEKVKVNVEEIQERTDGVFQSWTGSHPEWTVTFTYTNEEVVSAPTREEAMERAREMIANTFHFDYREGVAALLASADADVIQGRHGL